MSKSPPVDLYALPPEAIQEPPRSLWRAFRKIGPGLILAGSIVGTGELIATTSLGAEQGYILLWLILLSCVIKVFVQTELGRYAITHGKTTLEAFDTLPGPRLGTSALVALVTLMTVACVAGLPWTGYPIRPRELVRGFEFALPTTGIALAFATFGITGVGASELFAYPYWCIEKGYARFAGARAP